MNASLDHARPVAIGRWLPLFSSASTSTSYTLSGSTRRRGDMRGRAAEMGGTLCAMRTLLLLRHAKSSWADPALSDHDRPLAPRGRRAAQRLASHLPSEGVRVSLVLCSSARRARDTLELLRPALGAGAAVEIDRDLYGADATEILERLRRVDADVPSVMVVGHNPALQDLAIGLAGGGDETALAQLRTKLPTGALATLDLGGSSWASLGPDRAYLTGLVVPKRLAT